MNGLLDEWIAWMSGLFDEWMNDFMDEWMDGVTSLAIGLSRA
jgi:hypothetical protein